MGEPTRPGGCAVTRINIHPRPVTTGCDYYLPYHGNSYNQTRHVVDSYLSSILAVIPVDTNIELISDEYHNSRLVTVKKILSTQYQHIQLTSLDTSAMPPDGAFRKNYAVVKRPPALSAAPLIQYYLSVQSTLTEFSQRYAYQSHSRDHGYFTNVKRYWYQYGKSMPAPPTPEHRILYDLFQEMFDPLVDLLLEFLSHTSLSRQDIENGIMFRLNHNPRGSALEGQLVNRHADNSIVTAWIDQSHSGAILDQGQEEELDPTPIESLHDPEREIIVFPGFDYSNTSNTATPAGWHTVRNNNEVNRVAIVAFLKYL